MRRLSISIDSFATQGSFSIAHGSVDAVDVVTLSLTQNGQLARGECRPYARYGESPQSVCAQIETIRDKLEAGLNLAQLQTELPAGAARNAVDCALWDLKAKMEQRPVWDLLGLERPAPLQTAYTLSIDTPRAMQAAALKASDYGLLKIKIKDMNGLEAAQNILTARKDARLIIDANEALSAAQLTQFQASLTPEHIARIVMIEQPIAADKVKDYPQDPNSKPILCADESLHGRGDLQSLWQAGYRAVNVKLDKCGGLTEGTALIKAARAQGFMIMAGCMVSSSLAMAPMLMLAGQCDIVDLDGPILLAQDRAHAIKYEKDIIYPPQPQLWGY